MLKLRFARLWSAIKGLESSAGDRDAKLAAASLAQKRGDKGRHTEMIATLQEGSVSLGSGIP